MAYQFTTPRSFRIDLEYAVRKAGFPDPVCSKVRYVTRDGRGCLETSVFTYAAVRMPLETLQAYEQALRQVPGVVATRIVHDDHGTLRDQVYVTHLRIWDEP